MTPGNSLLTGTPNQVTCENITKPRPTGAAFPVYDWRKDALDSFHLALHLKALAGGHKRFQTISELYWIEQNGSIP